MSYKLLTESNITWEKKELLMTENRLTPNQIQKLLNQYLVADYEQPINGDIMRAVASRVTEKNDVLLLQAVDMDDSGPYDIAEPRQITALETYTPSWLPCPRLRRIADIVSAQAVAQQAKEVIQDTTMTTGLGIEQDGGKNPNPWPLREKEETGVRVGVGGGLKRKLLIYSLLVDAAARLSTASTLVHGQGQANDGLPAIDE